MALLFVLNMSFFILYRWKHWRLDTDGWLPSELKKRQVDDTERLTGYMYRKDASTLHQAIWDYVSEVLNNIYGGTVIKSFLACQNKIVFFANLEFAIFFVKFFTTAMVNSKFFRAYWAIPEIVEY